MADLEYNQIAKIKVFGIGGAGSNAVNRMVADGVQGVEFYVANTDLQALEVSPVANKIQLGKEGLGAGGNPDNGRKAAVESEDDIRKAMEGADMVFITAGMGGGTGTGAAPMFAKVAKELGCLTVGIVTKPFSFEGKKRMVQAEQGLEQLKEYVDSLIIISNNKVLEVIGHIPFEDAFKEADNILRQGVQTITDLIAVPAMINLDFADVLALLLSGKMYGIFALLFGLSFFIMNDNQQQRGNCFSGRFAWRMFLLAMLGIVNTAFFDGDILFSYAIYGLVLIPLSYLPTKWLWWVVAFLFIQPVEIYSLISGWQVDASSLREVYGNMYNGHQHGSFLENAYGNLRYGQVATYYWCMMKGRHTQTICLFILGMLVGRKRWFYNENNNLALWKKVLAVSILVLRII